MVFFIKFCSLAARKEAQVRPEVQNCLTHNWPIRDIKWDEIISHILIGPTTLKDHHSSQFYRGPARPSDRSLYDIVMPSFRIIT